MSQCMAWAKTIRLLKVNYAQGLKDEFAMVQTKKVASERKLKDSLES